MDVKECKKVLRKKLLQQRSELNPEQKKVYDAWICQELEKIINERKAQIVHSYIPMGQEIDVRPLIIKLLEKGIKVVCPKTLPKRKLENRVLHTLDALEKGVMGTEHPLEQDIYGGTYDLIIVPGLAFNESNYRLGYGGGYYDTFIEMHPEAYKIGIFYSFQKVKDLPLEAHDVPLDVVITDSALLM